MLGGTALGTAAVAVVLSAVRGLLGDRPASDQPTIEGPALPLLLFGTFGAVVLATLVTWWRVGSMPTLLRRAAMAMAAGLGTVLAALLAAPVHHLAGRTGLHVLAAVAFVAAAFLLRPRG